jgi:hypothetical protein
LVPALHHCPKARPLDAPWLLHPELLFRQKIVHHDRPENVTDKAHLILAGGEQAANALQPADSRRHATTRNAKVSGTIAASPLVMGRPYLFQTAEVYD